MIIACMKVIPLPGKRKEVLGILQHIQSLVRASAGCISCAIYEECADEPAILYVEQWRSQKELHRHIQSRSYLQLLSILDLAGETPLVCFHEVANSQGTELIETLRS